MRNAQAAESLQLEMCPLVQKLRVHMRGFRDVIEFERTQPWFRGGATSVKLGMAVFIET